MRSVDLACLNANAYDIAIRDSSCKGLLCFGVLQALEQEERLVKELQRVLKPNGQLWLDGLNRFCLPHLFELLKKRLSGKPKHLHYTSPWQVKKIVEQHGFNQVTLYWAPIMPGSVAFLNKFTLSKGMQPIFKLIPWLMIFVSHAYYIHARKDA